MVAVLSLLALRQRRSEAWISRRSSLLSGRGPRSARSGCRPACGSGWAEGYLHRVAGGGGTPERGSRRRACPGQVFVEDFAGLDSRSCEPLPPAVLAPLREPDEPTIRSTSGA